MLSAQLARENFELLAESRMESRHVEGEVAIDVRRAFATRLDCSVPLIDA
jgi:hypothetical protein